MKVEHMQTTVLQHTGIALVTESSVTMPSLNHNTAIASSAVKSKLPSCVTDDNAQFTANLTIRSRYLGEVCCVTETLIELENLFTVVCRDFVLYVAVSSI